MSVLKYMIPTLSVAFCFISAPLPAQSAEEKAATLVDLIMPQSEYEAEMANVFEFMPGNETDKQAFLRMLERFMPFHEMRKSYIDAYLALLSPEEMNEQINIYSSPMGKRWRQTERDVARRVMQDLQTKLLARFAALKDSPDADRIFDEMFSAESQSRTLQQQQGCH